jgi:hypothetical protein
MFIEKLKDKAIQLLHKVLSSEQTRTNQPTFDLGETPEERNASIHQLAFAQCFKK